MPFPNSRRQTYLETPDGRHNDNEQQRPARLGRVAARRQQRGVVVGPHVVADVAVHRRAPVKQGRCPREAPVVTNTRYAPETTHVCW